MINIYDKKEDCCGCFACENICPVKCVIMTSDDEGFWYPQVDYDKCINCSKCIEVCPIINKKEVHNHPVAYACINKNEHIRLESSSGGIFTLIAEKIIEDGGIVFGATFNEKFDVEHTHIETKDELSKMRGSKYVQSKIGKTYKDVKEFLESGRQVLYSGTPCQIAGLKSFLQKNYKNLFCIDIICYGVPSPKLWQKYILYRENIAKSKTRRISFRQKNEGWKKYSLSFKFQNDSEYCKSSDRDLYIKAFLINVCLRSSCYECRFKGINRQSDITLADFWGIQNLLPEMDDDKGTSLIFINSEKGKLIFDKIKDKCKNKEVNINEAVKFNPYVLKSVKLNPNRNNFFKNIDLIPFDKLVTKYCSESPFKVIGRKVKRKILNIITKIS